MLRITGGKVYDPANGIHGVVKDVCISDGRIVSEVEGGRTIDATGMVVFPGGVDIHTHVAGAALNFARAMTPENQRRAMPFLHTPERRAGLGGITPTTFATGYLYAGMGWTTVNEAAVPVLSARHTHEELRDTRIVDELKLPHALHLHCNNLGAPGNVETTLETMKVLEGHRAHLAHLQFHAYGGDDWHTMRSAAAPLAQAFNAHPNLTADAGAILFGDAVTVTADGPWQHLLYQLTGRKWGNLDVENETGCGIVPYVYKGSNVVNAVQWAVGLELLLLINDPWRVFLTTDHPNGACFWRYPEIIHLLMNRDFRQERVKA